MNKKAPPGHNKTSSRGDVEKKEKKFQVSSIIVSFRKVPSRSQAFFRRTPLDILNHKTTLPEEGSSKS